MSRIIAKSRNYARKASGRASRPPLSALRIDPLAGLFHRRWLVPTVAELYLMKGAKFITLLNRMEASRPALMQTLQDKTSLSYIRKNPGYGHPLRPEYILTDAGRAIAPNCVRLMGRLRKIDAMDVCLRKWSLPVLLAIGGKPSRFGEIRYCLGLITDRALTLALRDLVEAGLLNRRVIDSYPPTPQYQLAARARPLLPILRGLAGRAIL
ncbi:MAG: helix-turn-helix transcriptional regulator [Planctomycetes bacterium]|nr:helix-turn-helix transcriptional regulator [Planctomycetota bacterium]